MNLMSWNPLMRMQRALVIDVTITCQTSLTNYGMFLRFGAFTPHKYFFGCFVAPVD
jgi:hypothetical protein